MICNRVVLTVVAAGLLVTPGLARAADYHHVHITSASPAQGVAWYARHMGCEPLTDRSDAADCYGVEVVFVPQPTQGGSQGTGVDHIGFSFRDVIINGGGGGEFSVGAGGPLTPADAW
mgnify:CR=1 FL=1